MNGTAPINGARPLVLHPRRNHAGADADGNHAVVPRRQQHLRVQKRQTRVDAFRLFDPVELTKSMQAPVEEPLGECGSFLVAKLVLVMQAQRVTLDGPQVVEVEVLRIRLRRRTHDASRRRERFLDGASHRVIGILATDHDHAVLHASRNHRAVGRPLLSSGDEFAQVLECAPCEPNAPRLRRLGAFTDEDRAKSYATMRKRGHRLAAGQRLRERWATRGHLGKLRKWTKEERSAGHHAGQGSRSADETDPDGRCETARGAEIRAAKPKNGR